VIFKLEGTFMYISDLTASKIACEKLESSKFFSSIKFSRGVCLLEEAMGLMR
jgi:hypothetical protein